MGKILLFILFLSVAVGAQSRRVEPAAEISSKDGISAKDLFEEANGYSKRAFAEFSSKKIPYSDELREQTEGEQKQLAAKYAELLRIRKDISGDDRYYLGMLHWIAGNYDGVIDALDKFLAVASDKDERMQTARSIIVISGAKKRDFQTAERTLSDYLASEPIKYKEVFRMRSEMTSAYRGAGDAKNAALQGEEALKSAKWLFGDAGTRATAVDQLLEAGLELFDIYRTTGDNAQAVRALEDLRSSAVFAESSVAYFFGTDELIKFFIEIGEKSRALKTYDDAMSSGAKSFATEIAREDVRRRLQRRKKHYLLLGENAQDITDTERYINQPVKSLDDLRGKVVLLDFWAPWCGPCIDAIPSLNQWQEDFKGDFEIVGLTRYYGLVGGREVNTSKELEYLAKFAADNGMKYSIPVSNGIANQLRYDAVNLPTSVLIDRKGRVRYIEIGTSEIRLAELRKKIKELVAEGR